MHCVVTAIYINLLNIQEVHEHEIAYTRTHVPAAKVIEKEQECAVIFIIVGLFEFNMHDSISYTQKAVFRSSAVNIYQRAKRKKNRLPNNYSDYYHFFHSLSLGVCVFSLFKFHYSRRTFLTHFYIFSISLVVGSVVSAYNVCLFVVFFLS